MPVQTVGSDIELAVVVPANAKVMRLEGGVLDLGVGLHPIETAAHAHPEPRWIAQRFLIEALVISAFDMGQRSEIFGHRVKLLAHGCVQSFLGKEEPSAKVPMRTP